MVQTKRHLGQAKAMCKSADHHVADCTTYKQGMNSLRYTPDEDDMSQMEEHEFCSGLVIKIGAKCFFAIKKVTLEWTVFCFGKE